jgi:4-amino-4-deoxy-L-arabinose transferase-like glycosyltransferase
MNWLRHNLPLLPLVLLVMLGALLRFFLIGAKTMWLDEAFSVWVANHALVDLWSWLIRIDQHPLLYYSLLHVWQFLFGDLQGTVRAFSALCGVLTLPLFYLANRRFFDTPTALLATFVLTISPFHVRFAQETRMYALLTLAAAAAFYGLAEILMNRDRRDVRRYWIGLSVAQAAVMLTHNTATVFFPLALNLAVGGALFWKYWQGGVSSWPALNDASFERQWLRGQLLAFVLWLPWAIPFVIQVALVDNEFWIQPPTLGVALFTLHNFNFAFLPDWIPAPPIWNLLYWLLAGLGGFYLVRQAPARFFLLLSLFLTPFIGELLVSLRRPIFYERTLIWTTLPYYMLLAWGVRQMGELLRMPSVTILRSIQAGVLALLLLFSSLGLFTYYFFFDKEDWAKAAGYVAESAQPGDVILFNATWVQIPFAYYYRHYQTDSELRGLPVDLFDRGVLEPKMTEADVPYMYNLLAGKRRAWLVYSHDWYTDPDQIIPRELDKLMRRTDQQQFVGLQVFRYEIR